MTTTPVMKDSPAVALPRRARGGQRKGAGVAPWLAQEPAFVTFCRWFTIILFAIAILVPLWMVVATSLASTQAVGEAGGMVLWANDFSLNAYRTIFASPRLLRSLGISVFVTAVGTVLATTVTALCAYGLSRPGSFGYRFLLWVVLFTYLFGPGMIPVYMVVREIGIYNTDWALILPGLFNAFNLIVLRSFFMSLPSELYDSARIDGAGEWRIFTRIVLPLSKAPLAVIGLFYGVGFWNNFFNAMLYLDDANNYPLQMVLRDYVLAGGSMTNNFGDKGITFDAPGASIQMAVVVVAMIPVLLVYPFIQRHFVKGVIIGAVKG